MVEFTDNDDPGLLLGGNTFKQEVFSDVAGSLTFPAGMLLGRITASQKLVFYASGAVDGSEVPMAILTTELVTTAIADYDIRACLTGRVREDQLLVWTAGVPVVPTAAEVNLLHTFNIIGLPDRELQRLDNNT